MLSTLERLRTAAIVALLGIAVTHVFELPDKLKESGVRYQGILFIALIVGCVLMAAIATRAPARPWWTGVLALSALPLIAYVDQPERGTARRGGRHRRMGRVVGNRVARLRDGRDPAGRASAAARGDDT